jgi:hypothetical protein
MSRTTLAAAVGVLLGITALDGGNALKIQVSPAVSRAPAVLTVRVTVDPAPEDRYIEVAAASPTFYTSSEIQLDKSDGQAPKTLEFRNLPTGLYEVTAVLVTSRGPRASVLRLAKVEPSPGSN